MLNGLFSMTDASSPCDDLFYDSVRPPRNAITNILGFHSDEVIDRLRACASPLWNAACTMTVCYAAIAVSQKLLRRLT